MPRSPESRLVAVTGPSRDADDVHSGSEEGSDAAEGEEEEVYEVEAIHASRWDDQAQAKRYLVKWKGWPDADRTWEPVENLSNCIEILNKYERMKAERKEKAKKKAGSAQGKATPANESVEKPPSNAKLPAKPASKSKPRAKAAAETSEEEEGGSLAELDARRDQAKKKAKMDPRRLSQAVRSEDAVAKKWEEKAAAKEAKKPRSSAASTGSASSKRKAASPPRPARKPAKRPPEEDEENKPASTAPKKARRFVASESESEEPARPISGPAATTTGRPASTVDPKAVAASIEAHVAAAQTNSAASPAYTSIDPAAILLQAHPKQPSAASSESIQPSRIVKANDATSQQETMAKRPSGPPAPWAAGGALANLLNRSFKAKPAPPPAPAPAPATAVDDGAGSSRVRFAAAPTVATEAIRPSGRSISPPAHPVSAMKNSTASMASPAYTAHRAASPVVVGASSASIAAAAAPARQPAANVAAGDENGANGANSTGGSSSDASPPHGVAQTATAKASEEEPRRTRLRDMEIRLQQSSWYQQTDIFRTEELVVACAEAVPVRSDLGLRLKSKAVAILFSAGKNERMSGEGLALGYLLLAIGSKTPTQMSDLEALFLHRDEGFKQLQALYCELVKLDHTVEFFAFGAGREIEPILGSGYLVLPSMSALQLGAAFERYCDVTARAYGRTCQTIVHPATIARARSLPNSYRIISGIQEQNIHVIRRENLRLQSGMCTCDTSDLLQLDVLPSTAFPKYTFDEELDEIFQHLCYARAREPTAWRRFVVVVNEADPIVVERGRVLGIEVHTWTSLSALVKAHPFG
ncbi:hypothetical protein BMF94_2294 [Rhodotorula taiwanensis]|uniref:Chromo domain-containing protein n=1 Tax=Rhodotorula taiwanensis TaxID=741276 RepID=A0A2S5BCN5_9BASI|nr:hypothetical protein BMF94_2294 [Rhodotorula taiwanensis]